MKRQKEKLEQNASFYFFAIFYLFRILINLMPNNKPINTIGDTSETQSIS